MKTLLLISTALNLAVTAASAATFATIRNFDSYTNGYPILDGAGDPVSGSYAVGFYPDEFNFNQDGPLVRLGLVQFGSELNTFVFSGMIGGPNTTSGSIPQGGGSAFIDKNIFVLFGDGSTLDDSGLFAVFKLDGKFQAENELGLGLALADVFPGNGEVVYGNLMTPNSQPPEDSNFNLSTGLQLVATQVPEPSVSVLVCLAALALAKRRR